MPAPLKSGEESSGEPRLHDRPLSLTDEQMPKDSLEALLDALPSRSLPATPLAKKRSETVNYSPPVSPMFTEPTVSPSSNIIPVEINFSSDNLDEIANIADETIIKSHKESSTTSNKEVVSASQEDVDPQQIFLNRELAWDKIREVLQVSSLFSNESYDMLPVEDQEWMKSSSGLEQLRAFLAVCD